MSIFNCLSYNIYIFLFKEILLEEKEIKTPDSTLPENDQSNLGDEILTLISQRTSHPGEALVLLQQLSIFVWDQYKVDWNEHDVIKVADSRKQRYLDYISQLIDACVSNEPEPGL
jgi:hypothetical protein